MKIRKNPPVWPAGFELMSSRERRRLKIPVHPRKSGIGLLHMARRFSALVLPRMLSTFDSNETF